MGTSKDGGREKPGIPLPQTLKNKTKKKKKKEIYQLTARN
jgi:hypothetical protein